VIVAVFASSGFWAWLQSRREKKDARTRALMGLLYDKIMHRCGIYLSRGTISKDEYEDLYKYFYTPYREMGGDGTAEKLMKEVEKLPITGGST
jgi:hypothetical protein